MMSLVTIVVLVGAPAAHPPLATNPTWEALTASASPRRKLAEAGKKLGAGKINLAGITITGATLVALARTPPGEPLIRAVREALERPVDVEDFLLLLDDLLAAKLDLVAQPAFLPAGRARYCGVLLHPSDIYRKDRPRRYGKAGVVVPLDAPTPQLGLEPAEDGAVIGPRWAARYRQPATESARMAALQKANAPFAKRVASLTEQLTKQGAFVFVDATVRKRERGFLLYGSYLLSRSKSQKEVRQRVKSLRRLNNAWGLRVPIQWKHPEGWRATVEAARSLADTYGVVYATRRGARFSDHYDGDAIDVAVVNLPRTLVLKAPDGKRRRFDLSAPQESRDLSLTPRLVKWVEDHFAMNKLRKDYPHWSDAD